MSSNITTTSSKIPAHLEAWVQKHVPPKSAKVIFVVDATASRQETWDKAAGLTAQMFQAAAAGGGLEMQLVFFRGEECTSSKWVSDPAELSRIMSRIMCRSGYTQIERALKHVGKEHQRQKVDAVILISDSCEETPAKIYAAARELSVPVFMFQEGDDAETAGIYAKVASITKGATCQFNNGSAARLANLLKAVVAYATGGLKALANENSTAARLLLAKLK